MEKILEKAPKIKIIFFDIDDTLRVKDSAFMPESITEVFYKLREKGPIASLAILSHFEIFKLSAATKEYPLCSFFSQVIISSINSLEKVFLYNTSPVCAFST